MDLLGDNEGNSGAPGVSLFLDRSLEQIDGSTFLKGDLREATEVRHRWASRPHALRPQAGEPTDTVEILVQNLGLTGSACTADVGWVYCDSQGRRSALDWGQAMVWVPAATFDAALGRYLPGEATVRVAASRARQPSEAVGFVVATVADPLFQPWTALQFNLVKAIRSGTLADFHAFPPLALESEWIALAVADTGGLLQANGAIPTLGVESTLLVSGTRDQGTGSTGRLRLSLRAADGTETELALWDPAPDGPAPQWKLIQQAGPGALHCELQATFEGRVAVVTNQQNPDRVRVALDPSLVPGIGPGGDAVQIGIDDNLGTDNDDDYRIVVLAF